MTKSKTNTNTAATTLTSLADGITSPSLTRTARRQLQSRNADTPDSLIEMVSHLAEQGGGSVAGIPFDAATARAMLAQTSTTRTTISVGRQTLQRMEDDMIQQRATVADPAFAIYTALRRLVKTKSGNALTPAYEQMKAIVKNRPRRSRVKKPDDESTAAASPTPVGVAAASAAPTPVVDAAPPAATQPTTPAPAPKAVVTTSN